MVSMETHFLMVGRCHFLSLSLFYLLAVVVSGSSDKTLYFGELQ